MGILDGKKLSLPDVNVTEQQLGVIDSHQDSSAFLTYDGKKWYYESSRELGYLENETGQAEGLYRWLFKEQNGDRLLCIEKWEGEPSPQQDLAHEARREPHLPILRRF